MKCIEPQYQGHPELGQNSAKSTKVVGRGNISALKKVRVVTDLTKLHDQVH